MKLFPASLTALLLFATPALFAAGLTLSAPVDYQVVQRVSPAKGLVRIAGELSEELPAGETTIEARLVGEQRTTGWQRAGGTVSGKKLAGAFEALAGGWWRLEVRVLQQGKELAQGSVAHVGVGEVFVVAGQSNSANHGEQKQQPASGLVAAFDGKATWRIADDPQPGASGGGGSFIPQFADAIVASQHVPVGIIACGIGATSVREWLPKGATFPNPPTIEGRVQKLDSGQWMSKGDAYAMLVARMKSAGPNGFRAVLWHQGESDANQKDATRTLPGKLYREHLEKIIRESRREIGWDAPWFVAQASYHVPGDECSDDIRAAQASLWRDGLALEGPDSDALKGKLRERDGKGVHFSGEGLRVHGAKWAEKVLPWLAAQQTASRASGGSDSAASRLTLSIDPKGPVGPCSVEQWKQDWPGCEWGDGVKAGRLAIGEREGKRRFVVSYAVGGIGPEKGGVGWRFPIPKSARTELAYTVRFSPGFDWVKGGKLPGLCGGPENVSGGHPANGTNGFSVRLMWRADGRGEAYVYHRNQRSNYGDSFAFPEDFRFPTDTDVRVRIAVTMNEPGMRNGSLAVWVATAGAPDERQVVSRADLEWRSVSSIQVDSLMFETFHGGGDASWAPTRPCSAEFSRIAVTTSGPPAISPP